MFFNIRRELDEIIGSIPWDHQPQLIGINRTRQPARKSNYVALTMRIANRDHMKRAMERLDTVKERIPEG